MDDDLDRLVYEHMLLNRSATLGAPPPGGREASLDRSATILLSRLAAQGPMTVAELSEAFSLDISTVHRQLAAAIKHGLIEKIPDPEGGPARKHRPTEEGRMRLSAELKGRRASIGRIVADWPDEDVRTLTELMTRFNESAEQQRGQLWPRPTRPLAD